MWSTRTRTGSLHSAHKYLLSQQSICSVNPAPVTVPAHCRAGVMDGHLMNGARSQAVAAVKSPESTGAPPPSTVSPPFRFYDNRQKYLAFVNTCNEKSAVARRAAHELQHIHPTPPAIRIFDAGMGDATVLARLMRSVHYQFPTVPMLVVAKEISLEDVRLGLEKLPDRLFEHPNTVFVVTNLTYAEAPRLMSRDLQSAAALNWQEVRLSGSSAHEYAEQIEELGPTLAYGWQTKPSPKTGNPSYVRPSVLIIYREDHKIILDAGITKLRA